MSRRHNAISPGFEIAPDFYFHFFQVRVSDDYLSHSSAVPTTTSVGGKVKPQ